MLNLTLQKISTRLLLGYAIPLICLAGLGVSAAHTARETFALEAERDFLNTYNNAANDASYHLIDSIRKVKGSVINPTRSRGIELYGESRDSFDADIARLRELAANHSDNELMELTDVLAAEGERIDRVSQRIFSSLNGEVSQGRSLISELESDSVGIDRADLLAHIQAHLEENTTRFEISQNRLTSTLKWGTALATLTTLSVALLLFQQIRSQMNKLVGVVEQNGIQVTTSSTQIAASSRQLEASVTEQVASTTQITATATEIAATSEELSQTIERVGGLSESAAAMAAAGKQDLERMATTIQQLIAATATISSKLGLIDDKANNISAVVTTITKVADQTNLLSLNAAIEAEKAGEYGAGFSVVAREIRRLADQTAIATLDIESMVQEMLSSVSAGVMEMDKFTQDVGDNAESISQISAQMAQIIYQVQSLVPQFETVNEGMMAQAQGAQQIKAAMEQLNDTSQQTAESVKDTNQVILQLGDVAQDLQVEVAHFRLAV